MLRDSALFLHDEILEELVQARLEDVVHIACLQHLIGFRGVSWQA